MRCSRATATGNRGLCANPQSACPTVGLLNSPAFDKDCVHAASVTSLDQESPHPIAVVIGLVRDCAQPLAGRKIQGLAQRGFIRARSAPRARLSALFAERIVA